MTFNFIYATESTRIISATILDARFTIPELKDLGGFEVKDFVDLQISTLNSDTLLYKIETELGNMAGYFTLVVGNMGLSAVKSTQFLRPNYQGLENEINISVSEFVQNGLWKQDFLN